MKQAGNDQSRRPIKFKKKTKVFWICEDTALWKVYNTTVNCRVSCIWKNRYVYSCISKSRVYSCIFSEKKFFGDIWFLLFAHRMSHWEIAFRLLLSLLEWLKLQVSVFYSALFRYRIPDITIFGEFFNVKKGSPFGFFSNPIYRKPDKTNSGYDVYRI